MDGSKKGRKKASQEPTKYIPKQASLPHTKDPLMLAYRSTKVPTSHCTRPIEKSPSMHAQMAPVSSVCGDRDLSQGYSDRMNPPDVSDGRCIVWCVSRERPIHVGLSLRDEFPR